MYPYFPAIYPGEILYSVLARYDFHMGLRSAAYTMESLFENRQVIASIELPGCLQKLAGQIPPERQYNAQRILEELTLYPYFAAFQPPRVQNSIKKAMMQGKVKDVYLRLGLAAFRIERIKRLRFCSECLADMEAQYGELYWRRDHQINAVYVCPRHGGILLESTVNLALNNRHAFVAASRNNCQPNAKSVIFINDGDQQVLLHLQQLGMLSANLLTAPPPPRTFAGWTNYYRSRMQEAGLARSSGTMNQVALKREFSQFYIQLISCLPFLKNNGVFPTNWLSAMVRKHRKASHPAYHLLLQNFLAHKVPVNLSFGTGPWPCFNPLSGHFNNKVVRHIQRHLNRDKVVGVFSCRCGYIYTRWFDPRTGQTGQPRFSSYGPMLMPVLKYLIVRGASLRKTSRILHLDPKTVIRLVDRLDISTPWKMCVAKKEVPDSVTPIQAATNKVDEAITELPFAKIIRKIRPARLEWEKIDRSLAIKLKNITRIILIETPPIRITLAELERRADKPGWIYKRRNRLPKTMAYLSQVKETTLDFQVRRIDWTIQQFIDLNVPLVAWRIMRQAGLKPSSVHLVNAALMNLDLQLIGAA